MKFRFPYRKILVPLDFSDLSQRALEFAADLAERYESALVLLTVVDMRFPYPDLFSFEEPGHEYFKVMRERAQARMEECLGEASDSLEVEKLVVTGRPKVEIVAVAAEIDADLIVMATQGAGGLRSALLGSTAEAVIRQAACPVLLLPTSALSPSSDTY